MAPQELKAPMSLNHVAYPTFNTNKTTDFYTQVLGCKLVGAIQKDSVPSTGAPTPFIHTFFAMSSGECIAFFEVEGLEPPEDDGIPSWIRHIALNV
jgi:glyoxylase I family protein